MIEIENLTKSFGTFYALKGINLQFNFGEFWMIVGPNGAGKTTLLKIIATLSKPTSGLMRINNFKSKETVVNIRKQIGFIAHQNFLYDNLTARENLKFYAQMYHLKNYSDWIDSRLEQVGLLSRKDDLVKNFSQGMKRRLTIARALLNNPQLILLDEPFSGLDQQGVDTFSALLREFISPNRITIMTTHNLQLGWQLATHYAILDKGEILEEEFIQRQNFEDFKKRYLKLTKENAQNAIS